jgi:hypothetical protein
MSLLVGLTETSGRRVRSCSELSSGMIIPDDGGSTHLWNVGQQLFYTTIHPRRQFWTSYSPPWDVEISQSQELSPAGIITMALHVHISPGGWTIGQWRLQFWDVSLTPHNQSIPHLSRFMIPMHTISHLMLNNISNCRNVGKQTNNQLTTFCPIERNYIFSITWREPG